MNLTLLDAATLGDVPNLEELTQFGEVKQFQTTSSEQVLNRIKDSEIVLTNKVVLSKEILSEAKRLKLICVLATGTNNIDLEAAASLGIEVKNVAGYSTQSVAQHTFAMLFYLMEHLGYFDDYVKSGGYEKSPVFTHLGKTYHELYGKVFGVVGLGAIGRQVATIAEAFGAKIVYYSTSGKNSNDHFKRVDFQTLLQESDILSIHAPLNERTEGLFDDHAFGQMKPTAFLLNLGRGGIVNEEALVHALNRDRLAGAALDVLESEPIKSGHVVEQLKDKSKLLITPHIAWASVEARTELIRLTIANIQAFLNQ